MTKIILFISLVALSVPAYGQRIYNYYRPGDWVSYTNTRYVTGIARGFNTVYFGTTGGILRYDKVFQKWLDPITTSDGMPDNRVRRIAVDQLTDDLWIDTPSGASYYNPGFEEWSTIAEFPNGMVQPARISVNQLPQFFTPPGYTYFNPGILTDREMLEYRITQIMEDETSIAWMGIWGLGPARGDLTVNDLAIMPQGPFDDDVADLDSDGDEFWFLGGGNGMPGTISYYDRASGEWEYFDSRRDRDIISDQFYAVAHDDKYVWIGSEMGLIQMDRSSRRFRSYTQFDGISGERVTALLPIKNNLLIGTDRGVSVFDVKRDTLYDANTDLTLPRLVYDFAQRDSIIYAATDLGIFSLVWGGSNWKRLLLDSPHLRGNVYDIQVEDSLLYTVGEDGVVVVNRNNFQSTIYDRNTVFRNADLITLLVHDGVIWTGGNDGLFRYNSRKGNWYRYTTSDGLISMRIRSLAGDGDYVWIGTERGVTRFRWNDFDRSDWLQ
ncbi:MAG: hypothetical protein WBP29_09685 [Candidatus Zixiibacteriota bacterium]